MKLKLSKSDAYYFMIAAIAIQDQMTTSPLFRSFFYSFFKYVLLCAILGFALVEISRICLTKDQLLILIAFMILGAYTATLIGSNVILYITLTTFLIKGKDCDRAIKIIFKITTFFFVLNFSVFLIKYLVAPGSLETMPILTGGVRYLLFYDHPNNAAREYIFIVYMFAYIYHDRLKIQHWIAAILGCFVVFYFTKSDAVWTVPVIFLIWAMRRNKIMEKIMHFLVKYGVPLFTVLSFAMIWSAKIPFLNNFFSFINVLATNRLTSNVRAFNMYGLTWLGQASKFGAEFEYMGRTYGWIYADNMYLYMIIHVGTVYLLIMAFIFWKSSKYLNFRQMLPIVALLIFGSFENRVLSINVYFTLLIAVSAIYNRGRNAGIGTVQMIET